MKRTIKIIKSANVFMRYPALRWGYLIFFVVFFISLFFTRSELINNTDLIHENMYFIVVLPLLAMNFLVDPIFKNNYRNEELNDDYKYFLQNLPVSIKEYIYSQYVVSCFESVVLCLPCLLLIISVTLMGYPSRTTGLISFITLQFMYYHLTKCFFSFLNRYSILVIRIFVFIMIMPIFIIYSIFVFNSNSTKIFNHLTIFTGITGILILLLTVAIGYIIGYLIPLKIMQKRGWSR